MARKRNVKFNHISETLSEEDVVMLLSLYQCHHKINLVIQESVEALRKVVNEDWCGSSWKHRPYCWGSYIESNRVVGCHRIMFDLRSRDRI